MLKGDALLYLFYCRIGKPFCILFTDLICGGIFTPGLGAGRKQVLDVLVQDENRLCSRSFQKLPGQLGVKAVGTAADGKESVLLWV